tara:strand:- start:429 stop:584 length:156 start_codon:yes stop_codon:yes gene_type:complete
MEIKEFLSHSGNFETLLVSTVKSIVVALRVGNGLGQIEEVPSIAAQRLVEL